MSNWEKYLKSIYFDPSHPASFGGPDRLYKIVKKRREIYDFSFSNKKVDSKTVNPILVIKVLREIFKEEGL